MKKKIAVAGIGYVGLSIATLLSQNNEVILIDVVEDKVKKVNARISPIKDEYIEKFFTEKELMLRATSNAEIAYSDADFIIIATPTNYDSYKNCFDTHHIENVIDEALKYNRNAVFVIKSTIPIGYTDSLYERYGSEISLMFSPEFLREGRALYDNLYPSRIIVGRREKDADSASSFIGLLKTSILMDDVETLEMGLKEAECVKLFSNSYLAMRVAYFNELDTFAFCKGLDAESIVRGVCLDGRIGMDYNNPSFGYGGYCFPKDTKQMLANYKGVPQSLFSAIVESNDTRIKFIAKSIVEEAKAISESERPAVGIYKLAMKCGSDNFRESAIIKVAEIIQKNCDVVIYDDSLFCDEIFDCFVIKNIDDFKERCDLVVTNRKDEMISDIDYKVFTRDIFNRD